MKNLVLLMLNNNKNFKIPIIPTSVFFGIIGLIVSFYNYCFYYSYGKKSIIDYIIIWVSPFIDIWNSIGSYHTILGPSGFLNLANVILFLLFLIGSLIYYNSDGERSNLLRVCYSIILIFSIILAISIPLHILINFIIFDSGIPFYRIPIILKDLLYSLLSYNIINQLNIKNDKKIISIASEGPLSKGSRFLVFIIDSLIILIYGPGIMGAFFVSPLFNRYFLLHSEILYYMSLFTSIVIYYLIFEFLFRRTPGKMIVRAKVITTKGKLTFIKTLGRTFSRLVPFEPLSFFGDKGWHDQWTNTTVVKEGSKATKEQKITYEELGLIDA